MTADGPICPTCSNSRFVENTDYACENDRWKPCADCTCSTCFGLLDTLINGACRCDTNVRMEWFEFEDTDLPFAKFHPGDMN